MIKVTREQMGAIEKAKSDGCVLNLIVTAAKVNTFVSHLKPLNGLGAEQIVLAWHGHVEIEPQFVSFDEAMRASEKGKLVDFHSKQGNAVPVSTKARLKEIYLSDYSLRELREGNFTIEGGNR